MKIYKRFPILMLLSFTFLIIPFANYAQNGLNVHAVCKETFKTENNIKIQPGDNLIITEFFYDYSIGQCIKALYNNDKIVFKNTEISKLTFGDFANKQELWNAIKLENDFFKNYVSKYELRNELKEESFELIKMLGNNFGYFDDEYLNDYIQQLLYSIHDITLDDRRPGSLAIKILNSKESYAFQTPTGIMIITTGLLSTIKSEDELIGILAHEVAHFVLDHAVINIEKQIARQKRAEFWAGFATMVIAASEVYLNSTETINTSGELTIATSFLSNSIADEIVERMGNRYSIGQEDAADAAASKVLVFLKRDPKAFGGVLNRIKKNLVINGQAALLAESSTHPDMNTRISKLGFVDPEPTNCNQYDKRISMVNTYNALSEISVNDYKSALALCDRNIQCGAATEMDYIIKAMSIRVLSNSSESNVEALDLLRTAKKMNVVPNNYVNKQEGITLLRLNRNSEAIAAFQEYLKGLRSLEQAEWINDEIDWSNTMIHKCKVL